MKFLYEDLQLSLKVSIFKLLKYYIFLLIVNPSIVEKHILIN
jgi:hypothetical protein